MARGSLKKVAKLLTNINEEVSVEDQFLHDLIASIIREKFNWSNIFGMQTHIISSKESTTDNNFIVRTLVFQLVDTNGIVETNGKNTSIINYNVRR